MKSGKSNQIIITHYNYLEQGKDCLVFSSSVDTRSGHKLVKTRTGLEVECEYIDDNVFEKVRDYVEDSKLNKRSPVYAVLVDEAQFLSKQDVINLSKIVDILNIPVICYGLKSDFRNELFEGSKALLELSDKLEEIKTICHYCNKKATLNMRLLDNKPINKGESIQVGDEEYQPVCRKCYTQHLELVE